jgi:REP element-mobilizing transposase RayT
MSQSVARNLIHLVFSTKHREPLITTELQPGLFAYLVGVTQGINCPAAIANGVADHVHILFALHKTVALCKAVEEIKKASSKWAKEHGGSDRFYWQNGYGAFSVSPPAVTRVTAYIADQARHHATKPFQDEFRGLLTRAGEEWDERAIWD